MEGITWVKCPCCGAEMPFPNDHPVHTRHQLEIFVQDVLPVLRDPVPPSHPEVHEEVYGYDD